MRQGLLQVWRGMICWQCGGKMKGGDNDSFKGEFENVGGTKCAHGEMPSVPKGNGGGRRHICISGREEGIRRVNLFKMRQGYHGERSWYG